MKQQCMELRYKEVGALLASDAEASGYFGISATVYGNRLVVGAHGVDIAAVNAGKVYVYDWDGTAYVEVATITPSDAQAGEHFGISVALSSDRLVVGAQRENTAAPYAGKVYVYDWNGTAYDEVAQLTASDAGTCDYFGTSVALSSDSSRLVVGAVGDDTAGVKAGKVYVYDWNGTAYDEVAQLTASDAQAYDGFGIAVALSGDRLVVGAYLDDTVAVDAGKVYVYDWSGTTSTYDEVAQLTASDAQASDYFGISVALSGSRLAVGSYVACAVTPYAGKVYVYDWNGTAYIEAVQLTASDTHGYDYFGRSVALSGNRLLVGAGGVRAASLAEAGKVYIYD